MSRSEQSPDHTLFDESVDRLRSGTEMVGTLARSITDELTDSELLGLLDGDTALLTGLRQFARHGYNHTPIVAGAVDRLGLPGIRFTDGPRGVVMGQSTCFPVAAARGATWDPDLERDIGRAIGREGRAQGANLFGGVCVNLLRHPAWGRSQETYGEDPVHLGIMGSALTRGVREQLMACVKHFALNSMENARFQVDVQVDDDDLHEVYLPHFREVIEAGADAVMAAYNSVNGRWCGDDPTLLTDILRDEWQFGGFVMSDFLFGHRQPVESVTAGLDLEMPFTQQRGRTLPAALASGELKRSDALVAARRLVAAQLRWASSVPPEAPDLGVVACDDHRRLARRAAAQSMVLLKNDERGGRPLLPLDVTSLRRVAVIGALAGADNLGDRGSSAVRPPDVVRIIDGLGAAFGLDVLEAHDGDDVDQAVAMARSADVAIVVVGYSAADEGEAVLAMDSETMQLLPGPLGSRRIAGGAAKTMSLLTRRRRGEGGDRTSLRLAPGDEDLIEAVTAVNPRTVVVLIAGGAVLCERWREGAGAIVQAWYPGMEGGNALADVVTGVSEPGGRLPFAVPTDEAHLPHFDHDARSIVYDRWWGQRRFDRDGRQVAFPFGFGLGYTAFDITELALRDIDAVALTARADVVVRNVGARAGSTVVQIYADGDAGPQRARRQLLGFARITAEPNTSQTVCVDLTLRPLARRDAMTQQWSIVEADYVIEASRFSGDPESVMTPLRPATPGARCQQ
jgi:beta-glucosidase